MKYHIEKNTVQETLVIPLFGRLVCSEHFPELFSDPEAKRICDSLDYDFADKRKKMESAAGLFGALEVAAAGRWRSQLQSETPKQPWWAAISGPAHTRPFSRRNAARTMPKPKASRTSALKRAMPYICHLKTKASIL